MSVTDGPDECSASSGLCKQKVAWRGKNFRFLCERLNWQWARWAAMCRHQSLHMEALFKPVSIDTWHVMSSNASLMNLKKGSFKHKVSTAGVVEVKEQSMPSVLCSISCITSWSILRERGESKERATLFAHSWAAELQITQVEPTAHIY